MFMLFTNIKKYQESKVLKSSITKPTILQSKFEWNLHYLRILLSSHHGDFSGNQVLF